MKKINLFLLLAFFAGVTQIFAKQYCGENIVSDKGKKAVLTCTNPSDKTYKIEIASTEANFTGLRGDNMYCYINGGTSTTYHMTDNYTFADGKVTFTISSTAAPKMYTPIYLNIGGEEQIYSDINGKDIDWPASCSGGGGEVDPQPEVPDPTYVAQTTLTDSKSGTTYILDYTIVYNADGTITYTIKLDKNIPGLNPKINVKTGGEWVTLTGFTSTTLSATGTTSNTYSKDADLDGNFYFEYENGGLIQQGFSYTVGADNTHTPDCGTCFQVTF